MLSLSCQRWLIGDQKVNKKEKERLLNIKHWHHLFGLSIQHRIAVQPTHSKTILTTSAFIIHCSIFNAHLWFWNCATEVLQFKFKSSNFAAKSNKICNGIRWPLFSFYITISQSLLNYLFVHWTQLLEYWMLTWSNAFYLWRHSKSKTVQWTWK